MAYLPSVVCHLCSGDYRDVCVRARMRGEETWFERNLKSIRM
jgi:hypothetical protein